MFNQLYPNLHDLIERMNAWREASNDPLFDLANPLSASDIDAIYGEIECRLSPENLYCDGEISHQDAMVKRDYYLACAKELGTLTGDSREVE